MALDPRLQQQLTLPAICAPMFLVSGPELVVEACKAGIVGVLPRQNARTIEIFEQWLGAIRRELDEYAAQHPGSRVGPLAVNLAASFDPVELAAELDLCARHGVEIIISVKGNPTELARRVHDWGGVIFHDITTLRFAEKAIAAGVDGLICIGAGGGGHSGTISHLALIPKIRSIYDGVIVLAGAVSDGAAIRAAEVLGADLAYLGTRFIATQESMAPDEYKQMILRGTSTDLLYTPAISGVAANWLVESIRALGLDPANLPQPDLSSGVKMSRAHLPKHVIPWKTLWSAGQGIDLIDDLPSVAELVLRLRREYVAACEVPDMADAARVLDRVLQT